MAVELDELELVWPAPLFAQQARALLAAGRDDPAAVGSLLNEAFYGDAAFEYLQEAVARPPLDTTDPFNDGPRRNLAGELLKSLAEQSDQLRRHAPRRYYRARQQPEEVPSPLTPAEVKSQFAQVVAELASLGYFERAFGSYCYDSDDHPDAEGQRQLSDMLGENQSGEDQVRLWPMAPNDGFDPASAWSDGLFYDLIEALHDLVARPLSRYWHDFAREWDYRDYAKAPGQAVYRWRVNDLLGRSKVRLRLAESGEDTGRLVTAAGDARDDLVERALSSPEPKVRDRIEHAVALFRDRHATLATKRDATRTLADVLEKRKRLLKQHLLSRDESALFAIANNFELRHLNEQQKSDYDAAFLDWVFWWYLATVELTDRLLARQQSGD